MGTLYLAKFDIDSGAQPKFIALIGKIIEERGGYRFIPNNASHKTSRKLWPTANSCIPAWTDKLGFLRLLEKHELPERAS